MFSPKDDRSFCLGRCLKLKNRLRAFFLLVSFAQIASAESVAIIVTGLSGNETDSVSFSELAADTRSALIQRGMPERETRVLKGAKRDAILAELVSAAERVKEQDDFWLVLFGHAGTLGENSDMPAFQVRGQRLTAADLKDAVAKIAGTKWIFVGTQASGGFLPYLKISGVTALAATAESGEINQPRFPEKWVAELKKNPQLSFAEIAARATQAVEAEYDSLSLAVGENGRMLEAATGRILSAPYGAGHLADLTKPRPALGDSPLGGPEDIEIPKPNTGEKFQFEPATDETKRLIAEGVAANKQENKDGYSALVLRQEFGYTVNSDRTTRETRRLRVFLTSEQSLDEWANYVLPQMPPAITTKLEGARIILPDGSSWLLNPQKAESTRADNDDHVAPVTHVFFPQAVAGSLIEIAWSTDAIGNSDMPEFYDEFELQRSVPALSSVVTLKTPKKQTFNYQLANLSIDQVTSESDFSRVLTWQLPKLPAFEPLPFDPPRRDVAVWLGISSVQSWDAFAKWYRRISAGSDAITPAVAAKAKEIANQFSTRRQRIQGVYEFVSALRYIAIEPGIQGFRPRTPEQVLHNRYGDCKDKANLVCALLRAMDIPARFALVNRGSSTDRDFPGWQFNHAIAFVPDHSDGESIWLDSTDVTTPFGFLPPGDIGRQALVFNGEKAEFREVTSDNSQTAIVDEWQFTEQIAGVWVGKLKRTFSGLADYEIRQQLRASSPKQRQFFLSAALCGVLPTGDFSNFKTSNPDDRSQPIVAECEVKSSCPWAAAPLPFLTGIAASERDRPLILNDGQKWQYRQELTLRFLNPAKEQTSQPTANEEVPGLCTLRAQWLDTRTFHRTAICRVEQPHVSSAEYPKFRSAVRQWAAQLPLPPPNL